MQTLAWVAERESGLASGLNTAAFQIGGALGAAVVTIVAVSQSAGADPLSALTEGFRAAFAAALIFPAIGILCALLLMRKASAPKRPTAKGVAPTDRRREPALETESAR